MVGVRIDPDDWELPVTADQIVERTLDRLGDNNPDTRGQVVLLHDSGGDRAATVAALPELIRKVRERGFRFVQVSELAGLSRDQVMPLIPQSQRVFTRSDAVVFLFPFHGGLGVAMDICNRHSPGTGSPDFHWHAGIGAVVSLATPRSAYTRERHTRPSFR